MPNSEQVSDYRALRGRFLNALWDAEDRRPGWSSVEDLLAAIAVHVPEHSITRLINDLIEDGAIQGVERSMKEVYPGHIRLTAFGRSEVERWIDTDRPTDLLPVAPSSIINNFHGSVNNSPIVQQSTGTAITYQTTIGQQLGEFANSAKALLAQSNPSPEAREEIESDIEIIAEESVRQDPKPGRFKSAVRRTLAWSGAVAQTSATALLSEELQQLGHQILQLPM